MNVKLFSTPEEQRTGLLGEPWPLRKDTLYFFRNVPPNSVVHTRGLPGVIEIYALGEKFLILAHFKLNPNQERDLPVGTRFMVEVDPDTPDMTSQKLFEQLWTWV